FPCWINEQKIRTFKLQGPVVRILAYQFHTGSLRAGAKKIFEHHPSVLEPGNHRVTVTRFGIGRKNHAIPRIELMFHAVAFDDDCEGIWIAALRIHGFLNFLGEILISARLARLGPAYNRSTPRRRLRNQPGTARPIIYLIPERLRRELLILRLLYE